jgi:hypothetical protein
LGLRNVLDDPSAIRRQRIRQRNLEAICEAYYEIWLCGDPGLQYPVAACNLGKEMRRRQFQRARPDGMRVDTDGKIWTSAGDGVHVLTPEGRLLGKIRLPQAVANLTFVRPRRNRLFITATRSLDALLVAATGAQHP